MLTPDQIAAAVRAQLAPAIAPLGVVANTDQFLDRIERMAATLAVWGPKINLTAHPQDPDEIVFHVFDSIIPISIAVSVEDPAAGPDASVSRYRQRRRLSRAGDRGSDQRERDAGRGAAQARDVT